VLHRRLLVALSRDVTDLTVRRSALVLAPHPDDETLGCGGTIAKKVAAGASVHVAVAGDAHNEARRAECREACRRLGLRNGDLTFFGLPDGALDAHRDDLEARVQALVTDMAPDEVFSPYGVDAHADHRALASAVDALRSSALRDTVVLAYPIWYWNRSAWVDQNASWWRRSEQLLRRPLVDLVTVRTRVVRTGDVVDGKVAAVGAYGSQLTLDPDDPDPNRLGPSWLAMFLQPDEVFFALQEPVRAGS
jgi:LmbE family N-acetylglucosaminyl deacetylase